MDLRLFLLQHKFQRKFHKFLQFYVTESNVKQISKFRMLTEKHFQTRFRILRVENE